jgi:TonB family protein
LIPDRSPNAALRAFCHVLPAIRSAVLASTIRTMSVIHRETYKEAQNEISKEVQKETEILEKAGAGVPIEAHTRAKFNETNETVDAAHGLQLLVELPSRPQLFFSNLRDLIFPRRLPPLALRSAPAPFWHDVFVRSSMPWSSFFKSVACHVAACAALIAFSHLLALQPRVVPPSASDHSQIIYPSEPLPPLDTRQAQAPQPAKPDPELSPQPIISVPREADNRTQTIVTPPQIKLKRDIALPNIIAWSDPKKPQLAIQPAPLTLAADISRIQPQLNSVVAPPPDASQLAQRRDRMDLQAQVVAPPPAVQSEAQTASTRRGDITIAPSAVIAPAPALAVADQHSFSGRSSAVNVQVVPPPPSASGSMGAQGRMVALNLHPAVGAPPNPLAGNRRGSFAATPTGHAGASGAPGSAGSSANGTGSGTKRTGDLPGGLYVGSAGKTSPVAGDSSSATANSTLASNIRPSHVTTAPSHSAEPENAAKLSEPERAVFGGRKFYSLSLSMPNFNSAGGTWIIRFAEMNHDSGGDPMHREISEADSKPPAIDFSEPQATRKVDPAYPQQLMQENIGGTVILYAVIRADGTVGNVRVLRGVDSRLDRFASEAVAQWKFNPATKNGSPVDVEATFHIPFRPSKLGTAF